MSTETPRRYRPDHLDRQKVRDAGVGNRFWLSARIGNQALETLGAEPGDYIVIDEGVDPRTGEATLSVKLDPAEADS